MSCCWIFPRLQTVQDGLEKAVGAAMSVMCVNFVIWGTVGGVEGGGGPMSSQYSTEPDRDNTYHTARLKSHQNLLALLLSEDQCYVGTTKQLDLVIMRA